MKYPQVYMDDYIYFDNVKREQSQEIHSINIQKSCYAVIITNQIRGIVMIKVMTLACS